MSDGQIVEGEVVEEESGTTAIVQREEPQQLSRRFSLYHSEEPEEQLAEARKIARVLVSVVEGENLSKRLGGSKPHVFVDGWTYLGTMVGVFPHTVYVRKTDDYREPIREEYRKDSGARALRVVEAGAGGYEAKVEARTAEGLVIGTGIALCTYDELKWSESPPFELAAMAQTRAVSRALRQPLSSLMVLSGFASTPAEEMTSVEDRRAAEAPTVNDPHCPACLEETGELVPVWHNDSRPFWVCKKREKCAGAEPSKSGKVFGWGGWHKEWRASVDEWRSKKGLPSLDAALLDPEARTNRRIAYMLDEIRRSCHFPTKEDVQRDESDRQRAEAESGYPMGGGLDPEAIEAEVAELLRKGTIAAVDADEIDLAALVTTVEEAGHEMPADPEDEIRIIVGWLNLAEADCVIGRACEIWANEGDGRPFDE